MKPVLDKKIFVLLSVMIMISLPAFSMKVINKIEWNQKLKAEFIGIEDALEVKIKVDRLLGPAYVSNLNCHEYSRVYALKSSGGNVYLRPRQRSVRISREPTVYLLKIFREHKDNIYFKPNGVGLYGNLVGEFYIGNDSLSKHMVDAGYCDYVK